MSFDEGLRLLTTEEVADVLRLTGTLKHPIKAVQRLIREGQLEAIKVGERYLVRWSEILSFLERNRTKKFVTAEDFN